MAPQVMGAARRQDTVVALRSPVIEKCRLCGCRTDEDPERDHAKGVCGDCKTRPEARRLGPRPIGAGVDTPARDFTAAERSMIQKVHGYLPASQLLSMLNERLLCDLGPDANPYTMEQLHAEIQVCGTPTAGAASDWAGLRKLLSQARRSGVLASITPQMIDDFAVVYSLSQAQVLRLKDILFVQLES